MAGTHAAIAALPCSLACPAPLLAVDSSDPRQKAAARSLKRKHTNALQVTSGHLTFRIEEFHKNLNRNVHGHTLWLIIHDGRGQSMRTPVIGKCH